MIQIGNRNAKLIRDIQELLGIPVTGVFDQTMLRKIVAFQREHHLTADGIVNRATMEILGILDSDAHTASTFNLGNMVIHRAFLSEGEYIEDSEPIQNDYIILHHTAGWEDPFRQIEFWDRDNRGRIGTEFVIGGQNIVTGDTAYDGVTVQAFPEGCQAWHIGNTGRGREAYYMRRHSVGVELCNFGFLSQTNKTYAGQEAHPGQILDLQEPYRKHRKWHKYSEAQLKALSILLPHLANRDNIDIHQGITQWLQQGTVKDAFSMVPEAAAGRVKGLLLHSNLRKDKFDCPPQPEFIDMLMSL